MSVKFVIVFFLISVHIEAAISEHYWGGNWFPVDPGANDMNDVINETILSQLTSDIGKEKVNLKDEKHGIKMGIIDKECDDAKTNLTLDWDGSSKYFTCFEMRFKADYKISPIKSCDNIPKNYWAGHICMNRTIEYYHVLPTYGNHRPLWPEYGEYKYVPVQRWLHSLEHGGIVMLYHPCADKKQVIKLKNIIKNCMFKHIITPSIDLTVERPLALLSWGCRYLMNTVNSQNVIDFVRSHGMRGPEKKYSNGQYSKGLIQPAHLVYDTNDTILCPNYI